MNFLKFHLESNTTNTSEYNNINSRDKLRIGIIGVGAAGLAAIKALKDTDYVRTGIWEIVAFEERDDVGGIWYVISQVFINNNDVTIQLHPHNSFSTPFIINMFTYDAIRI